ncbi:MAG: 50S ribosomal protein L22 [Candidatus Yonathbacteria bacterium]|nr:50S ribosomal protein L22 [Candidatus Yonathbacteria bacterium]
MKAYLKSYRQAPRKVRLVTNLIKGKTVPNALVELDALPKRASGAIKKLLLSAVANAKENNGIEQSTLSVKEVRVDQGMIMKRSLPRSHGSANPIHKHTSHIIIELGAQSQVESMPRESEASLRGKKSKVKSEESPKVSKKVALAKVKAVAKPKGKSLKPKT